MPDSLEQTGTAGGPGAERQGGGADRGAEKSTPRWARSPNKAERTTVFSLAPCRRPNTVFTPSLLTPSATIKCWPWYSMPSM